MALARLIAGLFFVFPSQRVLSVVTQESQNRLTPRRGARQEKAFKRTRFGLSSAVPLFPVFLGELGALA
jgi:hypothetical protein